MAEAQHKSQDLLEHFRWGPMTVGELAHAVGDPNVPRVRRWVRRLVEEGSLEVAGFSPMANAKTYRLTEED